MQKTYAKKLREKQLKAQQAITGVRKAADFFQVIGGGIGGGNSAGHGIEGDVNRYPGHKNDQSALMYTPDQHPNSFLTNNTAEISSNYGNRRARHY
mmetsp:Transcript_24394/g.30301  ORF Transcript_24394/g.30301 Transcript_24394/m.30301 type:complete len:96 (-) Transcript_24394:156-443(-)